MRILGVHGHPRSKRHDQDNWQYGTAYHDSAAVLLEDGEIVAAVEQERIDRVKHSNYFPRGAVDACLEIAGCTLLDIDRIAFPFNAMTILKDALRERQRDLGLVLPLDPTAACARWLATNGHFPDETWLKTRLRFHNHHLAHAWGACGLAGVERSLVAIFDGEGDDRSGAIYTFDDERLTELRSYTWEESLGGFYRRMCGYMGFGFFEEYKVMGLAPYGDVRRYRHLFAAGCTLLAEGRYQVAPDEDWHSAMAHSGFLTEHVRRPGEPVSQSQCDLAAALQESLERIVLHVLHWFRSSTGLRHLSMSGGVAHNCSMNGAVLRSGLFDETFVQPAAHDAGNALGAAIATLVDEKRRRPRRLPNVFLGRELPGSEVIERELASWEGAITWARSSDPVFEAASFLANGAVVGWVQGRSEFGPRALGHRSILADPRPASNRDRVNAIVKKREAFRPFAPAVMAEHAGELFELPATRTRYDWMIEVVRVRESQRERLGAVTHVDGTARIQVVCRDQNPRFHALLEAFARQTGVPVLLNTSFNNEAEPVVDSPRDAIVCFLSTGLDALFIGDYLVRKSSVVSSLGWIEPLVVEMPPQRRVVRRSHGTSEVFELVTYCAAAFRQSPIQLSPGIARVLLHADGRATVGELSARAGVEVGPLLQPLHELWAKRAVRLAPAGDAFRRQERGSRS